MAFNTINQIQVFDPSIPEPSQAHTKTFLLQAKSSKCAGLARQNIIVSLSSEKSCMLPAPSPVDQITITTLITLIILTTTLNASLLRRSDHPDRSAELMSLRVLEQVKPAIAVRRIDIIEMSRLSSSVGGDAG
ncbi:hypothetical protein NHQ30_006293 [Ciborinia camelliae]|nr:hypothetical protein NHQ30_006293 [Ciborinia camelliae]